MEKADDLKEMIVTAEIHFSNSYEALDASSVLDIGHEIIEVSIFCEQEYMILPKTDIKGMLIDIFGKVIKDFRNVIAGFEVIVCLIDSTGREERIYCLEDLIKKVNFA